MKFYARINKQQVGPLSLNELVEAGIHPSTYVWTKGMADWQRADEVPDVCRAMRRRLAGLDPETGAEIVEQSQVQEVPAEESADQPAAGRGFIRSFPEPPDTTDYSVKPQGVSVIAAIVLTILCFPFTGIVAIFFALKCNTHWKMSEQQGLTPKERQMYQHMAHNDARVYRMLAGITFFLGMILIGYAISMSKQ